MKNQAQQLLKKLKFWRQDHNAVRVLAIDGGGVRGLIPALILEQMEVLTGKRIYELFDLVAGTSTGGALALSMVCPQPKYNGMPMKASEMVEFYETETTRIFSRSLWQTIRTAGALMDVKYYSDGMRDVLKERLGDVKMSAALTDVLITSFSIDRCDAHFFKSSEGKKDPLADVLMRQAAQATTAAPTYFEPYFLENPVPQQPSAFIDGGVFANNPAMCAYVEAKTMFPDAKKFIIVSLGTGELFEKYSYEQARSWALAGWVRPMINIMFFGADIAVDKQLRALLPTNKHGRKSYYRLQTKLTTDCGYLDDTSKENIQRLRDITTREILQAQAGTINEICERLMVDVK